MGSLGPDGRLKFLSAEFPDAYALISVEKWAEEKNLTVLVVSQDKGWREFCEKSERLVYRDDLASALKLFQPHNAAIALVDELNEHLTSRASDSSVAVAIDEAIKESVEASEIDVNADSRYYWEPSDVHATYVSHRFRQMDSRQIDIDLVRVTEHEVVVRLVAEISCEVHANFALSMTDPIDKDQVGLGSQDADVKEEFESDVLVTFSGDLAKGLAGVSVKEVELVNELPTVNFGQLEVDWRDEDDH